MDQLRRVLATIQARLGGLSSSQKLLLASLATLMLMTLFLVSQYAGQPSRVALLPGASPQEQQEAMAHLQQVGMSVSMQDGSLVVPPEQRDRALAGLAVANLMPSDTTMLFDDLVEKQNWMMPTEQLRQMFLIAKQNSMAKVVTAMPFIASAQVHIDKPDRPGFGAAYIKPRAQITVQTRTGTALSEANVLAIASVVAGGVAGLELADVRVIDAAKGRSYRPRSEDDFAASTYLEQLVKTEDRVRGKLEDLLSFIPRVTVSVNAQIDADLKETSERRVLPKGDGSEEFLSRESINSSESTTSSAPGEPGIVSNTSLDINRADGGGGGTTTSKNETEFTTGMGERTTHQVSARGKPTKIFASIIVPLEYVEGVYKAQNPDVTDAPDKATIDAVFETERTTIQTLVAQAIRTEADAAADIAAGAADLVRVSMTPAPLGAISIGAPPPGGALGTMTNLVSGGAVKMVSLGALAFVSLAMMLWMVKKASAPTKMPTAEELVGLPPALEIDADLIGEAEEADAPMAGLEVDDETLHTMKMLEEVSEMVSEKSEEVASILTRWITPRD